MKLNDNSNENEAKKVETTKFLANLIIEDYKVVKFNEFISDVFPGSNCDRDIAVVLKKMQFKIKWAGIRKLSSKSI